MTSASVEVVGAVCRRLTWSKYLYHLKHCIHILQTAQAEQKLAVRLFFLSFKALTDCSWVSLLTFPLLPCSSLLITVLDAFHFDHQTLTREMDAAKAREGVDSLFIHLFTCFRLFELKLNSLTSWEGHSRSR